MATTSKNIRPLALLAALGLVLGTIAGCSNDDASQNNKPQKSATAQKTTPSKKPIKSAEAKPSPSPSKSSLPPSPNLADAFTGYDKAGNISTVKPTIPGTWYAGEYLAQNAKHDIQIILLDDEVRIYSENWNKTHPYGTTPEHGLVANGIVLTAGQTPAGVTTYTEWPMGQPAKKGGDYREPQVIVNGQAIEHGTYVCGSNAKGVTCWNKNTGHGAFVTAQGFTGF